MKYFSHSKKKKRPRVWCSPPIHTKQLKKVSDMFPSKLILELPRYPATPFLSISSKELEAGMPILVHHVHGSIIHHGPKGNSPSSPRGETNVVCQFSGILVSHEKEMAFWYMLLSRWTLKIIKWNKTDTKVQNIALFYLHEIPRIGQFIETERAEVDRGWGRGRREWEVMA